MEWSLNLDVRTPDKPSDPVLLPTTEAFVGTSPRRTAFRFRSIRRCRRRTSSRTRRAPCAASWSASDIEPGHAESLDEGAAASRRRGACDRSTNATGAEDRSSWYPQDPGMEQWPVDVSFLNERPAGEARAREGRRRSPRLRRRDAGSILGRQRAGRTRCFTAQRRHREPGHDGSPRWDTTWFGIHHHDSDWVEPNVFDRCGRNTQKLDDERARSASTGG